jgi:hypothetical protein
MRERACTFGSHGGLVGILCDPDGGPRPGRPAVLLFNVGLDHHVGPHRLNVELARHLAGLGFSSLRFDLSGLGDSEARPDLRSDSDRAATDLSEAMDLLTGMRRADGFVVMALCSGVDPAHAVAVTDGRVRGAVLIDGYAYVTRGWRVRERAERLRRRLAPASYPRWVRRHVLPRLGRRGPEVGAAPIFDRSFPPLERFTDDLATMLARGVRLLFLYTRQAYFYNHRGQFAAMIGERRLPEGVEVERWARLDHVLTPVAERGRAVRRLGEWMLAHFGEGVEAEAAADPAVPEERGVFPSAAEPDRGRVATLAAGRPGDHR